MATPYTESLGNGNGGHKHGEDKGRAQALLEFCHRFLVGSGQPSVLMLKLMMLERETMACFKKTAMRHKRGE